MDTFKWKCPECEAINADVTCSNCGHMPEYYIPLKSVTLKPEKIKPVPDELEVQEEDWRCTACGMMNEAGQKKCYACDEPKEKKIQKKEEEKKETGVRGWLVMSVFLISFLILLIVLVGKIVVTTRPELLSGDLSLLFKVPAKTDYTAVPIIIPTEVEVINRVYPNPPQDGCILWSEITPEHDGKSTCVYGLVYDTFIGEPTQFNIRFSDQKDTFRMVMTGLDAIELELKPPAITGECVYQTGEIKYYKSLPYISFTGMVLFCEK